jgi:hypothetical protein
MRAIKIMKWIRDEAQYACGKLLMLGNYHVGGCHYDSCRSKGNPLEYKATCKLPGIRTDLGNYLTEEEAMIRAEYAVKVWIKRSGLQQQMKGE